MVADTSPQLGTGGRSIRRSSLGLIAGFAALLSLMAFLAWVGLSEIESNQRRLDRLVNDHMAKIELTSQMRTMARERTIVMQRMLLVDDPFDLDELWIRFKGYAGQFIEARSALLQMPLSPREQLLLERQGELTRKAVPLQERVVALVKEDRKREASKLLRTEANAAQDAVLEVLGQLYELQRDSARAAVEEATIEQRRSTLMIVVVSTLALLIGITVALIVVVRAYRASREREFLATHDALTQLPNRLLLHDRIERELLRAERGGHRTGIMFLDLDRFKVVNDTLGHAVGDRLLQLVASRLRECIRETDTVARLGGDEFVVLVEQAHSESDFVRVAEKIVNALKTPLEIDGQELYVTTSIGISVYPGDGRSSFDLLKHADVAMYHAKDNGRNNYQFYSSFMTESVSKRLSFENSMRRALEREELRLHYQPIVELVSGRVVGAEALLRWNSAEQGDVPPSQFVPLLEETGLIVPVGEWVVRTACRDVNTLTRRSLHQPFRLSINVSGRQLSNKHFATVVEDSLREAGLRGDRLEFELTESVLSCESKQTLDAVERLGELGVKIAIDDFGTAYSSLARLKQFAIDRIKIDRSFVRDLATSADDASIVSAILAMARNLEIAVVAEGVETKQQLEMLRRWGCLTAQGFLFSPAVPIDELAKFVRRGFGDLSSMKMKA